MAEIQKILKQIWHFIWEDDSLLSWVVNAVLAFIIVKWIIYPLLAVILGTSYPIVAVVSNSMEHTITYETWLSENKEFYSTYNFKEEDMRSWKMKKGFNKGDIIILKSAKSLEKGDIAVYKISAYSQPIIHRVVNITDSSIVTKGDNVKIVQSFEQNVPKKNIVGKAWIKIPYLGWIKIKAVELYQWILT